MNRKADFVVVGGGISGSAIFHELSRAGLGTPLLIERGKIAGATTGESGGYIRKFNTDPFLAQLAAESFDYYQRFEEEVGGSCDFRRTGLVSRVSDAAYPALESQIGELVKGGHEIIVSSSAPTSSLLQANYASAGHKFIYEPELGNINTRLACRSWVDAAVRNGADFLENTRLEEVLIRAGKVWGVRTSNGIVETEMLILSAGAWSKNLLEKLPVDSSNLTARSFQYNIYIGAAEQLDTAFMDNIEGFYTAPFRNGNVFAGTLGQDRLVNQSQFDHEPELSIAEQLHAKMSQHFAFARSAEPLQMSLSYDAFTDDGRGVIKSFSELPGLVLATAWSSGGIKSAPAVAKLAKNEISSALKTAVLA